jgi:hypothetical protein
MEAMYMADACSGSVISAGVSDLAYTIIPVVDHAGDPTV